MEEAERRIREAEAEARAGGLTTIRTAAKLTAADREALQRGTVRCGAVHSDPCPVDASGVHARGYVWELCLSRCDLAVDSCLLRL